MSLLSCHTRYRIDAVMNCAMGILLEKLMLAKSKSKPFFWSPFVITVKPLVFKYVCLQVWDMHTLLHAIARFWRDFCHKII